MLCNVWLDNICLVDRAESNSDNNMKIRGTITDKTAIYQNKIFFFESNCLDWLLLYSPPTKYSE